ncbi:RNA-binding domain-containing protein, partial [Cutaneotrichosporon oleaginosum]
NRGNNLHVSGLARSITDRGLEDHFSKVGKIVKAQVMLDPHTQESRGFGFVMFETSTEAENAITEFSGKELEGRVVTVTHAKRGRARTPTPGRYHG